MRPANLSEQVSGSSARIDARRECPRGANVLGVRKAVGDDFPLMLDPASQLRIWMDALYVGQACDEAGYYWYEDPYRDTRGAIEGHKRLRERLKTLLLVGEHVRGIEAKAAFILAGGGDIIHADPEYDMGITGALKIAAFCQALGLDVQYHACGLLTASSMRRLRIRAFTSWP